jgi:hypothetical protein
VSVIRSDAAAQRKPDPAATGKTDRQGRFVVALPSRSVVTVTGIGAR